MMRVTFLIVLFFAASAFQNMKLVKTKVNDSITLSLPEEFTLMTEEELNRKYVSAKAPVAVYTDFSKTVDLGVNIAYSRWNAEDLEIMMSFYKSNIMGLYDEVQFITETVQEINGRDFVVFEFLSKVNDTEGTTIDNSSISRFVRIQYTIARSKTVLFNFSCPERMKDKWAPIANEILESVKISKTL
jgi:hypothetical protein